MNTRPGEGGRHGVAAFDFDGTIVAGDSFLPFLCLACGTMPTAVAFGRSVAGSLGRRGGLDRDSVKERLVSHLLGGREVAGLLPLARAHAADLVGRARPGMLERIDSHRRAGDLVAIVSASPELYLQVVGDMLGVDAVLATKLEVGPGGRLTGDLDGANCRGPEKVARLRAFIHAALPAGVPAPRISAYGDSVGDAEMMAIADVATWIGPRGSLRQERR